MAHNVTPVEMVRPEVVRVLSNPGITLGRNRISGRQKVEEAPRKVPRQHNDLRGKRTFSCQERARLSGKSFILSRNSGELRGSAFGWQAKLVSCLVELRVNDDITPQ